jgi:hypothetical protein
MPIAPLREVSEQELVDFLSDLFWSAFRKAPFEVLCAVLRVSGMEDADWDPFEESKAAFEDYNALLRLDEAMPSQAGRWRIGLLMYCQAVEMTAPQEFLANLLRVLSGKKYHIKPFGSLGRTNKKKAFSWVPPSAPVKYRELKRLAAMCNQSALCDYINQFFNEDIRNAFSHSDYVISGEHFRWTESGLAQQLPLDVVNLTVRNCFRFFSTLLWLHNQVLTDLKTLPRFHKWPNYEVLELLSDTEHLYGFSIHFSNGAKATYSRSEQGTECTNVLFESDGSVNFMVGLIDALRPEWKVNGQPYEQAI